MKTFTIAVIFNLFVLLTLANSKSLKSLYGNNLGVYKGQQRKPLASQVPNGIHDAYTRSKRQTPKAALDFQDLLTRSKQECAKELGFKAAILDKSLLYEPNPTEKEKCLIACLLQKVKLMDKNKKLSSQRVASLASQVSNENPLVVSVAVAVVNKCNNLIHSPNTCEAAHQINRCIAFEMKAHKLKMFY